MTKKRWTLKEEQFLIDRYCDFTNSELANILKRPFYSIQGRAKELGLTKAKRSNLVSKLKPIETAEATKPKIVKLYEPSSINKINETYKLRV